MWLLFCSSKLEPHSEMEGREGGSHRLREGVGEAWADFFGSSLLERRKQEEKTVLVPGLWRSNERSFNVTKQGEFAYLNRCLGFTWATPCPDLCVGSY